MEKTGPKKTSRKIFILQKASVMFLEKGFSATSMRDLATAVGIEAASLYNHIRSKNEILEAICFDVANRFTDHLEIIETGTEGPLKKAEIILRFHIRQMIEQYEEVVVSDHEWKHLDEPYLSNFHNQRRSYRKRFASIIEEGIKKNEIKDIDPHTSVLLMLHAVSGIESWHHSTAKVNADQLEENIVMILIDGLRKQG